MLATSPEREPTEGNLVEVLLPGTELFLRLQEDIMAAEERIHANYYIFGADDIGNTIRTALMLKALDSLDVRFIGDNLGSKAGYTRHMESCGVQVKQRRFFPLRPRNHQKFLLLDFAVGYTGGVNISYDSFYDWIDCMVRFRGPIVAKLEQLYARMWEEFGGETPDYSIPVPEPYEGGVIVQAVGDLPKEKARWNLKAHVWAVKNAKTYFWAKTPYIKPPQELFDALIDAARRGVDVRLMTPWVKDHATKLESPFERVLYEDLVRAGVHLYIRPEKYDHSKIFVTDDYLSSTGTINLDVLSFCSNYEDQLYFYDEGIALQFKSLIEDDFDDCYELTLEHIKDFPLWMKFFPRTLRRLGKLF